MHDNGLKWHYSTVQSMKNVAVLTEDGHLPSFFIPTPGDLTPQESPFPGICHPRQNQLESIDALYNQALKIVIRVTYSRQQILCGVVL